jgi:hypothetical protein
VKPGDRAYFRRRARIERRLSERAASIRAAQAHAWLAIEYEDRLRSGYAGLLIAGHDDPAVA